MAEVPNQAIIDRYKELLANRTHDTIVRDLALDVVESEYRNLKEKYDRLSEEHETMKRALARANESLAKERGKPSKTIPGEIVEKSTTA